MLPEVQEYVSRIDDLRRQVKETVEGLDAQGLSWTPLGRDTNSLAVLMTHMAWTERFWTCQVIGGRDIGRNRDAEFIARAAGPAELEALQDQAGQDTREALAPLTLAQLREPRTATGRTLTVQGCLLYLIEHLAGHLGHMQLTRQMYDQKITGSQPERVRAR